MPFQPRQMDGRLIRIRYPETIPGDAKSTCPLTRGVQSPSACFMIVSLKTSLRLIAAVSALGALPFALHGSLVENFSDLHLPPDSQWYGSDGAGSFRSGSATYYNRYDPIFSWSGFAYSNSTNGALSGWDAQFTAVTLGGMGTTGGNNPGGTYAVGFFSSYDESPLSPSTYMGLDLAAGQTLEGLYVTNSLYTYTSMRDGDGFSKKFGGESGDDKDWLLLTISGRDASMNVIGTVEVYLADYRFDNNVENYILNDWLFVDLSGLSLDTEFLSFSISSSDNGQFGMNTPAYFALGGLEISTVIPEPTTTAVALALAVTFVLLRRRAHRS